MKVFRRVLGPFAMAWLLVQAVAVAPGALWVAFADAAPVECRCTHGDHAICPMHHRPAPGSKICVLGDADGSGVALLGWLWNAWPAAAPPQTIVPESPPAHVAADVAVASLRPARPDPPPPRF